MCSQQKFTPACTFTVWSESWGPPRSYGEHGDNVIYFRGTGEHKSKYEGNRGTNVILGSREHSKLRFWFWGTRENAEIFQGNKEEVPLPSLGGPQSSLGTFWIATDAVSSCGQWKLIVLHGCAGWFESLLGTKGTYCGIATQMYFKFIHYIQLITVICLTLKVLITTAVGNILILFWILIFCFSEKIRLDISCESSA